AVHSERCIWAVADPTPASVARATAEDSKYGGHMGWWAAAKASELKVTEEHVWRWQVWREKKRQPAKLGKRTRQWLAVVARDLSRAKKIAAEKHAAWEREHLASLPDHLRRLQQTCRCSCLVVSPDGDTVTERLHDVGGTMTMRLTGKELESLADMQARHD